MTQLNAMEIMVYQYTDLGELAVTVFRLNSTLLAWGDRFSADFNLSSARWQILGALARSDTPLTAPQIADAMGISRQGVQKQLNLLLDQKFLITQPNPTHRRSCYYILTPAGQQTFNQIDTAFSAISQQWAKALPNADFAEIKAMLYTWQRLIIETENPTKSNK